MVDTRAGKTKPHERKGTDKKIEGCGEFQAQRLFVVNGKCRVGIKATKGSPTPYNMYPFLAGKGRHVIKAVIGL